MESKCRQVGCTQYEAWREIRGLGPAHYKDGVLIFGQYSRLCRIIEPSYMNEQEEVQPTP
jgi:hypothetical protein